MLSAPTGCYLRTPTGAVTIDWNRREKRASLSSGPRSRAWENGRHGEHGKS
jgi:hypothetical protein